MQRRVLVIFVAQVDGHVEGEKKSGGIDAAEQEEDIRESN